MLSFVIEQHFEWFLDTQHSSSDEGYIYHQYMYPSSILTLSTERLTNILFARITSLLEIPTSTSTSTRR